MSLVPKHIELAGIGVDVVVEKYLYEKEKVVGLARYPRQQIALDPTILTQGLAEHNYFHELTHWILYIMNEDDLRNNEKFVDCFAFLLHQAQKSSKDFYSPEELCNHL